jgi:hypothetical protein
MRLRGLGQRLDEVARRRRLDPPLLARAVRGDLDWIVMKSLDKDRARRYEAANSMARDVERHLNGELVTARPPSVTYRTGKFILRNRAAVTVSAFGVAALALLVFGAFLWQERQTREARRMAAENRQQATRYQVLAAENLNLAKQAQASAEESHRGEIRAHQNLYAADISQIQHALATDNLRQARELLHLQIPKPGEHDLRGFEWRYLWQQCQGEELFTLHGHEASVDSVSFSPDGRTLATASWAKAAAAPVKIWDLATRQLIATLNTHTDDVSSVCFSPGGELLVTASLTSVWIWNATNFQRVRSLPGCALAAQFSPRGEYLVTAGTDGLVLWDVRSWTMSKKLDSTALWYGSLGEVKFCYFRLAFSPDGTRLGVTSNDGIRIYSFPELEQIEILRDRPSRRFLAFSPDGHTVAACTFEEKT